MTIERQMKAVIAMSTESVDALAVRLSIALSDFRESSNSSERHRAYLYVRSIAAIGYWRFGDDWKTVVLDEVHLLTGETHEVRNIWRHGTEVG